MDPQPGGATMIEKVRLSRPFGGTRIFHLSAADAAAVRAGQTRGMTKWAFAEARDVRRSQPAETASQSEEAQAEEFFTCATANLKAKALLLMIDDLHVSEFEAMDLLDGALDAAGPDFARSMIQRHSHERIPF